MRVKSKISDLLTTNQDIKLEIGAGDKKGSNGWLTLDLFKSCDLTWDLRNGIPFPDGTVNMIYSSHLFEHLTFKEINLLLQECKRALKEEGVFSICVPNARLYIDAYIKKQNQFITDQKSYYKPAFNSYASIDLVNYIAYMDGHHKYMFDQENLISILEMNDFRNVKLRVFDPNIDLSERDHESIYAISNK